MSFKPQPPGFATKAITIGQDPRQWQHLAVVPPTVASTTFMQSAPGAEQEFCYGRKDNPTRAVLEQCLASLDGGKYALAYASGTGACLAATQLLRLGDRVLCAEDIYGGSYGMLKELLPPVGIHVDLVDMTDLGKFEAAMQKETKMVWMESPTNPLCRIIDIEAVAGIIAKYNNDIILLVDNTFLTPYFQRPLELGADLVLYSLSKFINGHSDVIMGAMVTNDEALHKRLRHLQGSTGIIPSPHDCAQVNRSLKTLALRLDRHSSSALAVAQFLEQHPLVVGVRHPGLPSHPQHQLALRQQYGQSGMFAFYVRGGHEETSRFMGALRLVTLAMSFGGYGSLVGQPSRMLFGPFSLEERAALGITDNMIRLSVGLEDVSEIIADLDQALKASVVGTELN